jgi:hypothetical protein
MMNTTQTEMTLEAVKEIVRKAGFEVCNGASWEDDKDIYASSVKTVRGCYGHPAFEVMFSKESGWLSVTGYKPTRLTV